MRFSQADRALAGVDYSLGKEDCMDKGRHPHVIRTWTVERTKVPYRPPQPAKSPPNQRREPSRGTEKNPQNAGSARKNDR
jgi:hypothetical protein